MKESEVGKSPAINIVIKLVVADGVNVVKLSDDVGKHQGDAGAIGHALKVFEKYF